MGAADYFKDRAVNGILTLVQKIANSKVDIAGLQAQYGATQEKLMRMTLVDLGKNVYIRVTRGRIQYVSNPNGEKVLGGFDTTSDVLFALYKGKRKYRHPGNGREWEQEYTPVDAVTQGGVRVWGDAASNDMLLFTKLIYGQVYPTMRKELDKTSVE